MLLRLSGLHNSDDDGIDDVLSLDPDLFIVILHVISLLSGLLLMGLRGNKLDPVVGVGETSIDRHLLFGVKGGLLHVLLVKDLELWVTEVEKGIVHFLLWNGCVVFHLLIGQGIVAVEEQENHSLVAVNYEDVFLLETHWLKLHSSMME